LTEPFLELFSGSGTRVTPMNDADHFRHYARFLNLSFYDRFDFDLSTALRYRALTLALELGRVCF